MHMKMFEFMLLEQRAQADHIYEHGVFLGKQKLGRYTRVLYQIEDFYVEISYKKYRLYIDKIKCFLSTDGLDPYLRTINIEELINQ